LLLPPLLLLAASLGPLLSQDVRDGLRHMAVAALGSGVTLRRFLRI
jgi:hypothetical protein